MTNAPPAAAPAASLIVLREVADAPPAILMVERAARLAFAGGKLAFPGGRVDPGDRDLAVAIGGSDPDEAAARIAAVRETIEEAGLGIGLSPPIDAVDVARARTALAAGAGIGAALAAVGTRVALDALTPFARWRPGHRVARAFDTRFYLACLPADAPPASVDATETVRLFWSDARATLASVAAREASVIVPTRRLLERLARFATIGDALADAQAYPTTTITPWVETRGGVDHLCIPEGLGYPVTAEPLGETPRG